MKISLKRITLAATCLVPVFVLAGCGSSNPAIGTWKSDYKVIPTNRETKLMGVAGKQSIKGEATLKIESGKIVRIDKKGDQRTSQVAKYKVSKNGNKVTAMVKQSHGRLNANVLHIVKGGKELYVTAPTGYGPSKIYFKKSG